MKKTITILGILIFSLSACSGSSEEGIQLNTGKEQSKSVASSGQTYPSPDKESTVISSSGELKDTSGYGFEYSAANAMDLDWSTAWCASKDADKKTLTLTFADKSVPDTIGIVSGFARNEDIFMQNNRLKAVSIFADDSKSPIKQLKFEDEYKMHFFELSEKPVKKLKFVVDEIYAGNKYDDTCIAEIDMWSDWVANKDSNAAYAYYLEYKKDKSLRPVDVRGKIVFGTLSDINECGAVTSREAKFPISNSYAFAAGTYNVAFSAKMNEEAEIGDVIKAKLVYIEHIMPSDMKPRVLKKYDLNVYECEGEFYVSGTIGPEILKDYIVGTFALDFYFKGKLIERGRIQFTQ